jgi:hypothetical protein
MFSRSLFALLPLLVVGCGELHEHPEDSDHEHPVDVVAGWGLKSQSLAVAGRWQLPADVLAAGDEQSVQFDNAPPYNGGSTCSGGATQGALALRSGLIGYFPQVKTVGIYNCRAIAGTNSMSLHGVGRALDIMIPTTGGQADNGAGDPIANWLVENAEALGVQTVIWDSTIWRVSNNPRARAFTGSNPHIRPWRKPPPSRTIPSTCTTPTRTTSSTTTLSSWARRPCPPPGPRAAARPA